MYDFKAMIEGLYSMSLSVDIQCRRQHSAACVLTAPTVRWSACAPIFVDLQKVHLVILYCGRWKEQ